jgi:hypothetical protein
MSGRVLVLHGIWNTRSWMLPLVWRLRRAGIDAHSFGYDSILGGPGRRCRHWRQAFRRRRLPVWSATAWAG